MKTLLWVLITIGLLLIIWGLWPQKVTEAATIPSLVETPAQNPVQIQNQKELNALNTFFSKYNCPLPNYAADYIQAANQTGLDYRVLPSLSILESTCGRYTETGTNNWWGWNSGKTKFQSVPQGIEFVENQLGNSPDYENKSLKQKLYTYNSVNPKYYSEIIGLMNQISK